MTSIWPSPNEGNDVMANIDITYGRGRGLSDVHFYGMYPSIYNAQEGGSDEFGAIDVRDMILASRVKDTEYIALGPWPGMSYWIDTANMLKVNTDPEYWPGVYDKEQDGKENLGDGLQHSAMTPAILKKAPHTFILKPEFIKFIQSSYSYKRARATNNLQGNTNQYIDNSTTTTNPLNWPGWGTIGFRGSVLTQNNHAKRTAWIALHDGQLISFIIKHDWSQYSLNKAEGVFLNAILPAIRANTPLEVWAMDISTGSSAPYNWDMAHVQCCNLLDSRYLQAVTCIGIWEDELWQLNDPYAEFDEKFNLYTYDAYKAVDAGAANSPGKSYRFNHIPMGNGWHVPLMESIISMLYENIFYGSGYDAGGNHSNFLQWWEPAWNADGFPTSIESALLMSCTSVTKDPLSLFNMFSGLARRICASTAVTAD